MPTLNFSLFNCSAGLISSYFIVAGFRLIQRYTILLSLTTQNYHRVTMIPHYADKKLYATVLFKPHTTRKPPAEIQLKPPLALGADSQCPDFHLNWRLLLQEAISLLLQPLTCVPTSFLASDLAITHPCHDSDQLWSENKTHQNK